MNDKKPSLQEEFNSSNEPSGKDVNSFLQAAKAGDNFAIAKLLNDYGSSLINKRGSGFSTALIEAAEAGNNDTVAILLENGADLNIKKDTGATALLAAVWKGHKDVVAMLLEKGADIEDTENMGRTALMIASIKGLTEIVSLLLEKGADIDAKITESGDYYSHTSLMFAAEGGHIDTIALLLKKSADADARSGRGYTALELAKRSGKMPEGSLQPVIDLFRQHQMDKDLAAIERVFNGGFTKPSSRKNNRQ